MLMSSRVIQRRATELVPDDVSYDLLRLPRRRFEDHQTLVVRKLNLVRAALLQHVGRRELPNLIGFWGFPDAESYVDMKRWLPPGVSEVSVVADLSPAALASWVVAREHAAALGLKLPWRGVRDSWLGLPGMTRDADIEIVMSEAEQQLWVELRSSAICDWERELGPSSVALLDRCRKLELDGVFNPQIFSFETRRDLVLRELLSAVSSEAGKT